MYNPHDYGHLSRVPIDNCPLKHSVCWFRLCPYAIDSGEYVLVNWEVKPMVKCKFPFIGRIKAEPDTLGDNKNG